MSTALERVAEWAVPGLDPDPGPMARLEAVKANENTPSVIFQRVAEGETLREIAKAWQVPVGRFVEWYTTEHADLYETALRARADQLAHEALGIADGADKETVAPAKLQVDTRLKLAGHWDRNRYGGSKDVSGGGIQVFVDRSCGGTVQIEAPGGSKLLVGNISTEPRPVVAEKQEREISGDHNV